MGVNCCHSLCRIALIAVVSGWILACGAAAGRGQPIPPAARGDSADELLAGFRRAWQPQPGYMRTVYDMGWRARMTALCGLVRLGSAAVPALASALEDESADMRAFAAQALGFIADGSVASKMDRLLTGDPDPIVRLYAADARGMFGGMRPSDAYENVTTTDVNKDVRAHVRFALERNGERLPADVQKTFTAFRADGMDTARLGAVAADFTLTDALGQTYRLSDFRGKKVVVLVFIYGDT